LRKPESLRSNGLSSGGRTPEELDKLLPNTIEHKLFRYDEQWQALNHAFEPKGTADVDSQKNTVD
jgi:hypothetical protein